MLRSRGRDCSRRERPRHLATQGHDRRGHQPDYEHQRSRSRDLSDYSEQVDRTARDICRRRDCTCFSSSDTALNNARGVMSTESEFCLANALNFGCGPEAAPASVCRGRCAGLGSHSTPLALRISRRVIGPRNTDIACLGCNSTGGDATRAFRTTNQRDANLCNVCRSSSALSLPLPDVAAVCPAALSPSKMRVRSASVCSRPRHHKPAFESAR